MLSPSFLFLSGTFKWYDLPLYILEKPLHIRVEFLLLLLFPFKNEIDWLFLKIFPEWKNYIPSTKIMLKTKVKQAYFPTGIEKSYFSTQ